MSNSVHRIFLGLLAAGFASHATGVAAQQTLANPLVRPAASAAIKAGNPADAAAPKADRAVDTGAASDPAELRRQAERRITQEDLNIRQQALNQPVLPVPLQNLFANMQVTAHFQGAVVMRRVESEVNRVEPVTQPAATGGNGRQETAPVPAAPRPVARTSPALRLKVGKAENISGYMLRAQVSGQDITVDWLSDGGRWVNVFFGSLESSAGGLAQVPAEAQLQKVETDQFDYLVPELRTRTFSPSGSGGGQPPGNFGQGIGGGSQGFNNQPGFGTGFPN